MLRINRRDAVKRTLLACAGFALAGAGPAKCKKSSATNPTAPESCEPNGDDPASSTEWVPSVLAPVFYGYADYHVHLPIPVLDPLPPVANVQPLPSPRINGSILDPNALIRVYYPTVGGSPRCAPFLNATARYPLILFLHGDCSREKFHYTKWARLPAILAKSGFVVAVPDLYPIGHPSTFDSATYARARDVIEWMRLKWSRRSSLAGVDTFGIIGHSWGGLHALQLATQINPKAVVTLSSQIGDFTGTPPRPDVPKLFFWGSGEPSHKPPDSYWNLLTTPKHKIMFNRGQHWDYVPAPDTACGTTPGPCDNVDNLAADFAALFMSKYMPPPGGFGDPASSIPDNLTPPEISLTVQQQFFAGSHLKSFDSVPGDCGCTVTWETASGPGTLMLPP